jgi:hypothetical protein
MSVTRDVHIHRLSVRKICPRGQEAKALARDHLSGNVLLPRSVDTALPHRCSDDAPSNHLTDIDADGIQFNSNRTP